MATKTINAFTAITSIEAADEILAWDASAGTTRKITWANALTNATLVTPTIASFANAQHTHANAAGGGTLTGYLAATGATTGATSQAQTFTNGTKQARLIPPADSTTALTVRDAADSANKFVFDTTNTRFGVNTTPSYGVDISNNGAGYTRMSNTSTSAFTSSGFILVNTETASGHEQVLVLFQKDSAGSATGTSSFQLRKRNPANTEVVTHIAITGAGDVLLNAGTTAGTALTQGNVGVGVTSPTAKLHVAASSTARASVCVNVGTAPTTPVAGDIWNDGALSFYNADATTNAIVNHLRLRRNSTGTAAAGFGLGIIAELESSTTDAQSAGRLTWEWATATHASRAAKGKLTAFYTSTEREAITWVADSSSVKVGINQPTPTAKLHIANSASTGGDDLLIESGIPDLTLYQTGASSDNKYWDIIVNSENLSMRAVNDAFTNAGNFLSVERTGVTIDSVSVLGTGVGIGTVTAPQSLLHGHDGSGGFLFVNRAAVDGTLVTVIPDATGDVTEKIFFVGWCTNSSPFSADIAPTTLTVSSSTTKTDGTNTLTIAVTAGGAFTLQATAGAATWNVNLWVFWR